MPKSGDIGRCFECRENENFEIPRVPEVELVALGLNNLSNYLPTSENKAKFERFFRLYLEAAAAARNELRYTHLSPSKAYDFYATIYFNF